MGHIKAAGFLSVFIEVDETEVGRPDIGVEDGRRDYFGKLGIKGQEISHRHP